MTVDDRTRLNLHRKLDEVLGADDADTLMAHLPPVTWNEVATKDDLRSLETVMRAEIAATRAELSGEIGTTRGEIATTRAELRGEIARAMERQIRWTVTFNTALAALALAAARLLF